MDGSASHRSSASDNANGYDNGVSYHSRITMSVAKDGDTADWQISTGDLASCVVAENGFGSNSLELNEAFAGIMTNNQFAHEFGHALGLTHSLNWDGGNIMYYSTGYNITGDDLSLVAHAY